jgi:hypothetical protein
LPGTWREETGLKPVSKGRLLAYLNPVSLSADESEKHFPENGGRATRRVIDREDLRQYKIEFPEAGE